MFPATHGRKLYDLFDLFVADENDYYLLKQVTVSESPSSSRPSSSRPTNARIQARDEHKDTTHLELELLRKCLL